MWERSAFVSTPGNVPTTVVPDWIDYLWLQVASGCGPPGAPLEEGKLAELRRNFGCGAWVWCVGPTQPGGGEPEDEARHHSDVAIDLGFTALVVNFESFYDAGGNQADPRFAYPRRYLAALLNAGWDRALGVTTTPAFGSDMTDWVKAGAINMPQAFTLENHYGIGDCVEHAFAWGWPVDLIRPLIQCYETNGVRPVASEYVSDANIWGVGVIPYVIEQACDDTGLAWLEQVRPIIERPQPTGGGGGGEPDMAQVIGSQHGITAMCNNFRSLWPQWTNPSRVEGDLSTYKGIDKLERTLLILAQDHDEAAK